MDALNKQLFYLQSYFIFTFHCALLVYCFFGGGSCDTKQQNILLNKDHHGTLMNVLVYSYFALLMFCFTEIIRFTGFSRLFFYSESWKWQASASSWGSTSCHGGFLQLQASARPSVAAFHGCFILKSELCLRAESRWFPPAPRCFYPH